MLIDINKNEFKFVTVLVSVFFEKLYVYKNEASFQL